MPITDKIVLEGNISRINDKELDKYIWFDICKNEKYQTKEGEMKENSSFFSVKIDRERIDNKDISPYNNFALGQIQLLYLTLLGILE